jgi:hypothetical protein
MGRKDMYVLIMSFCLYVDYIDMATMRNSEAMSDKYNLYENSSAIDQQNVGMVMMQECFGFAWDFLFL